MPNNSARPICYLGKPCRYAGCPHCSAAMAAVVLDTAVAALWPRGPGRELLFADVTFETFLIPGLTAGLLTTDLSKVFSRIRGNTRGLVGSQLASGDEESDDCTISLTAIIDRPYSIWIEDIERAFDGWGRNVLGLVKTAADVDRIRNRHDLRSRMNDVLFCRRDGIVEAFATAPYDIRQTLQEILDAVRSDRRIASHGIGISPDGLLYRLPDRTPDGRPSKRSR